MSGWLSHYQSRNLKYGFQNYRSVASSASTTYQSYPRQGRVCGGPLTCRPGGHSSSSTVS